MNLIQWITGTLIVVYTRVSTDGQSEQVQFDLAQSLLEGIPKQFIRHISDHGVSALRVPMSKRAGLQKLISLIKEGVVKVLIVYDRDRLVRDYYEAMELYPILNTFEVKVIFTAKGAPAFGDYLYEAFMAILAEQEGKRIGRRTADANQMYPAHLVGYTRAKYNDETQYRPDGNASIHIEDLFSDVRNVASKQEFVDLVFDYAKILSRTAERILEILQTPFFAGVKRDNDRFVKLPHVTPIVTQTTFEEVGEKLQLFIEETKLIYKRKESDSLIEPLCDVCGGKMKFTKEDISSSGEYRCSQKHDRVMVSVDELNDAVVSTVQTKMQQLDREKLAKTCFQAIKAKQGQIKTERNQLNLQLRDLARKIVLNYTPGSKVVSKLLEKQEDIESNLLRLQSKLSRLDCLIDEMDLVVEGVQQWLQGTLKTTNLKLLVELVVSEVSVNESYISVNLHFSRYYTKENELNVG